MVGNREDSAEGAYELTDTIVEVEATEDEHPALVETGFEEFNVISAVTTEANSEGNKEGRTEVVCEVGFKIPAKSARCIGLKLQGKPITGLEALLEPNQKVFQEKCLSIFLGTKCNKISWFLTFSGIELVYL